MGMLLKYFDFKYSKVYDVLLESSLQWVQIS